MSLELVMSLGLDIPISTAISLVVVGAIAFIVSTLSGGGGALLLIPIITWLIGGVNAPPVINLGTFMSRPVRLYLFWQDIHWRLVMFYAPSAIIGAAIAGFIFSQLDAHWIQLAVGVFLVSTVLQYRFGKINKSFFMPKVGFIPLGFLVAIISTLVGGLGPVMNPFYMNAGLTKEDLIATKTANSFIVGLAQLGSYSFFGILTSKLWLFGLMLGLGAMLGNIIGKRLLAKMTAQQFRSALLLVMTISGLVMIYQHGPAVF